MADEHLTRKHPEGAEPKVDTHAVYKAVWAAPLKPAGVKLVALAYAKYADPDGSNVYPGRASIMRLTGYGEDFVRDTTKFLIEIRVLETVRDATYSTPAVYRIDLGVLNDLAHKAGELRAPAREKEPHGPGPTRGARVQEGAGQQGRGARVSKGGGRGATQPTRHQPGSTKGGGFRPPADAGGGPRQKNYLKVVSS